MSRTSSRARGRAAAQAVVDRFAIRTPADIRLEAIAWMFGAQIVDGGLTGAAARLLRVGDRGRIRLSSALGAVGVRRFSVAHELGHLVLAHASRGISVCQDIAIRGTHASNEHHSELEAEAHGFAAELLMPERIVVELIAGRRPSVAIARAVASAFQTSLEASAIRMVELAHLPCAAVYVEGDSIEWASCSPGWHVPLTRRGPVPPLSAARAYRDGRPIAAPRQVEGSVWHLDERHLVEEVEPTGYGDGLLTILAAV
jgi:hypothetical protein